MPQLKRRMRSKPLIRNVWGVSFPIATVDGQPQHFQQHPSQYPNQYSAPPNHHAPQPGSSTRVVSFQDDLQRLLNACETARGNASLLHEALAYANPPDLKNKDGLIQEFLARCRASQELIVSRIPWATSEAERSRQTASRHTAARAPDETAQERLLAALLNAHGSVLEAVKAYEDRERAEAEREAQERTTAERKLKALNAITAFEPTASESALVDQIIAMADQGSSDTISAYTARSILSSAKLPSRIFSDIWHIANVEESDVIARQCLGVAVRLVGHAQQGVAKITESLVNKAGPLPVLDILTSRSKSLPPTPLDPVPSSSSPTLPPLSPQDRSKFLRIFFRSGPRNGVLSGDDARSIFLKSKLPLETLAQIWDLADPHRRGALDPTGFSIAMYLIQARMAGQLTAIPSSLPPRLHAEASGGATVSLTRSSAPPPSIVPEAGPSRRPSWRWEITPEQRTSAHEFFEAFDDQHKGYLDEQTACSQLAQTGLSKEVLARIWTLADVNADGRLSRSEFAVVLHLVEAQQAGQDLPTMLPDSLRSSASRDAASGLAETAQLSSSSVRGRPETLLIDLTDVPQITLNSPVLPPTPINPALSASTTQTPALRAGPLSPRALSHHSTPSTPTPLSPLSSAFSSFSPTPLSHSRSLSALASPTTTARASSPPGEPGEWSWEVTPREKAVSDKFFEMLDPWKHGFVEGEAAVPFLSKSKLPEGVLAQIWDLADGDRDGRLTREEFALAMHLIRGRLAGKEVPERLPPSIAPPAQASGAAEEREVHRDEGAREAASEDGAERSLTPPPPYESIPAASAISEEWEVV